MNFKVAIDVMPKKGISDPQGQTIERALPGLGLPGAAQVRVGQRIEFSLEASDEAEARSRVEEACRRFLTNPVIQDFDVHLQPAEVASNGSL